MFPSSTLSQAKEVVQKLCIGLAGGRASKAVTVRKEADQVRQVDGVWPSAPAPGQSRENSPLL